MSFKPPVLGFFLVALMLTSSPALQAATNLVEMGDYFFDPAIITINPGDAIKWTNTVATIHDSTHSPPSGPLLWKSGLLAAGTTKQSFTFVFTNAGVYPYFCLFHQFNHPEQT